MIVWYFSETQVNSYEATYRTLLEVQKNLKCRNEGTVELTSSSSKKRYPWQCH